MKKISLTFLKTVLVVGFLLAGLTITALFFSLESSPSTKSSLQLDANTAKSGKVLLKRLYVTAKKSAGLQIINASQQEINGLIALGQRAFPRISANSSLSEQNVTLNASIKLPLPSLIQFLNVSTVLLPSSNGIVLGNVKIGAISIKGQTLLNIIRWLTDTFIQDGLSHKIFDIVKAVKISNQHITVFALLDRDMLDIKSESSLFSSIRDELALLGNVETIRFYYQSMVNLSKPQTVDEVRQQSGTLPLSYFVNHIFNEARKRSASKSREIIASENKAALLGLILYFGPDKFKLLVGSFSAVSREDEIKRYYLKATTRLQGRVDLQKHFIYSIALKLFSTSYASDAVGEFKEFLDSNEGGSGFSFADLLADRAGTRLAMIATNESVAYQAQSLLIDANNNELMPAITGLKEGLSEVDFAQQYNDVQSKEYQSALIGMDNRLKTLPLYQLGW